MNAAVAVLLPDWLPTRNSPAELQRGLRVLTEAAKPHILTAQAVVFVVATLDRIALDASLVTLVLTGQMEVRYIGGRADADQWADAGDTHAWKFGLPGMLDEEAHA